MIDLVIEVAIRGKHYQLTIIRFIKLLHFQVVKYLIVLLAFPKFKFMLEHFYCFH